MSEFIRLLEKESVSIIEGLTGHTPEIILEKEEKISESSGLLTPLCAANIKTSGDIESKISMIFSPLAATSLADFMVGGEGEAKEDMNDDDLDAFKEIVSNIFGSFATALSAQKDLPKLGFEVLDAKYYSDLDKADFSDFEELYIYRFKISKTNTKIFLAIDKNLYSKLKQSDVFSSDDEPKEEEDLDKTSKKPQQKTSENEGYLTSLAPEELRNISLIMDVQLPVRVRIGTKKMLLKDVLNMDIGSVIELDQLANEPLDILVGNKVIGKGEVVIVDGNFGIQIVKIGSQKERLEQLK